MLDTDVGEFHRRGGLIIIGPQYNFSVVANGPSWRLMEWMVIISALRSGLIRAEPQAYFDTQFDTIWPQFYAMAIEIVNPKKSVSRRNILCFFGQKGAIS
jgi:hypothetical protein